ncbi:MAG: hypothetical protein HC876_19635 [Chloroflexaceae bacterium]|nr:hypothetical protein [Chloroflexaceae bacterium]
MRYTLMHVSDLHAGPPFNLQVGEALVEQAHNLRPELQAKIQEAFATFDWKGSALLEEFGKAEPPQEKFAPINYKQHWQVVRDIDRTMNVSYACK